MARKEPTQLPEFVAHPATTPPENPDLIQHLSFEHTQIERLWSELQLGHRRHIETEYQPGTMLGGHGQHELARRIVTMLAEHDAVELQMLYPAVERVIGEELAGHATADHEEIRRMLDEVDGEDPTDDVVYEAFGNMMTMVMAHIEEEERIAFPMLRAVLTDNELRDLGQLPQRADVPADDGDVIDIAAAERAQQAVPSAPKPSLAGRLLRRS